MKSPQKSYVNDGGENGEEMAIVGFRVHRFRQVLTWICVILTVGFLRLVFHWKPEWMLYLTHRQCTLDNAEVVLLKDQYKQLFVCKIKVNCETRNSCQDTADNSNNDRTVLLPDQNGKFKRVESIRYFKCKKSMYIWHAETCTFERLTGIERGVVCSYFHQQSGLSSEQQKWRRDLYSDNTIVVPVHSIIKLLFLEVLNPFYVFQVFSVSLWYSDEYEKYATVIVLMSVISITVSIIQIRRNQVALRDTVSQAGIMTIWRGGDGYVTVPSEEVVPGDVIIVPSFGCTMQCDAVLINGNCIVNEASLTGESIPVTKTPLPHDDFKLFDDSEHAKHVLFCGTKVIQSRYYGDEKVKAVVINTGFLTKKGKLIQSIMFPKPVDFKFSQDAAKFIMFLFLIALCGFAYTIVVMERHGENAGTIAKRALDLITIVVPPALPAAMTIGIIYAQNRLSGVGIFCISPRSINISGGINCACFDKTGTLTEEGLDVCGVVPASDRKLDDLQSDIQSIPVDGPLMACMAVCHSLTIIDQEVVGDPLDVKMYESTGWEIEEPDVDDSNKYEMITPTVIHPPKKPSIDDGQMDNLDIGIIRQFTFSSHLQRMSVVTRTLSGKRFELYAKGSPEMISSLCLPETVPVNFADVLQKYTMKGFRVIGLGHRTLPKINYTKVQKVKREDVECELTFLGLLVMENRIKMETSPTIQILHQANIKTIMITGDNILTGISVARDSGMLTCDDACVLVTATKEADKLPFVTFSPTYCQVAEDDVKVIKETLSLNLGNDSNDVKFAVDGKSFDIICQHFPDLLNTLMLQGVVFARMSPANKQFIIEHLQALGYYVAMCGDGANDCGALKAAHAGISLSEAEASAASPFTSKNNNISCVPLLISEGRAALVTSFGMFKYMAVYSMCQFVSVLILYTFKSSLTDWQFIYIDLFLITLFAALFGRTAARPKLSRKRPLLSLISMTPIVSLLLHVLIIVVFQFSTYFFTKMQPWYVVHNPDPESDDDNYDSFDNFAIFSVSIFQYISIAVVFSKASMYRKSVLTNYLFMLAIIIMSAFSIYLVLYPATSIVTLFEMKLIPSLKFRAMLLLIGFAYFITSLFIEIFVIDHILFTKFGIDDVNCCKSPSSRHDDQALLPIVDAKQTLILASSLPKNMLSDQKHDRQSTQIVVDDDVKIVIPIKEHTNNHPNLGVDNPGHHQDDNEEIDSMTSL
ncbi:Uncharacterised protein g9500 [Pycnogonum litorale]